MHLPNTPLAAIGLACLLCHVATAQQEPAGDAAGRVGWTQSYDAGYTDGREAYAGGSEIMHLAAHKGRLYAANGYWMDARWSAPPYAGKQSAQVLRLDSEGTLAGGDHLLWKGSRYYAGALYAVRAADQTCTVHEVNGRYAPGKPVLVAPRTFARSPFSDRVLFGTFCAENGHALVHHDRDFDLMATCIGLRIYEAPRGQ